MNLVVFGNACGFGGAQTAFRRLVEFFISEGHSVGVIGVVEEKDVLPGNNQATFSKRIDFSTDSRVKKFRQTFGAAVSARRHSPGLFVSVGLARSASVIARFLPGQTFRVAQDFICGRGVNDPLLLTTNRAFDALAVQAPSMVGALRGQGYAALPLNWLPCFPDPPQAGFSRAARVARASVRLAYFGRLASNKGIDLLLQSVATAKLAAPVALDIWGGGSELEKLEALAKSLSLGEAVQFRGRYPEGADYARLLCGYDGLVLPSTGLEGLPLILLEAMAYGVPFLTTRIGAIPDCCMSNADAVLVEPTLEAIRAGLEQFVARAAVDDFSVERLRQHYQTHFSHAVMADRWRAMLKQPQTFFNHV